MRKIIFYLLVVLFILPACSSSKYYGQKRGLMILDVTEQPRNKKALAGSRKRAKRNKKKVTKRSLRTKVHRRR